MLKYNLTPLLHFYYTKGIRKSVILLYALKISNGFVYLIRNIS